MTDYNQHLDCENQNQNNLPKYNDIEAGFGSPEHIHTMLRKGFIKKVYGILTLQLVITVGLMCLSLTNAAKTWLINPNNFWLFWVSFALSIVIIIPLICFKSIARKVPMNYVLLILWTVCESIMLSYCCAMTEPKIVMLAGVMTVAITVALTIYACTTKTDFTMCGGLLFCLTAMLIVWGIFSMIFGVIFNTLYCILGLLVFSIYLIYDTQLVLGKFGVEFQIDDYVYAALSIYLDIIQIFLFLLRLLSSRN